MTQGCHHMLGHLGHHLCVSGLSFFSSATTNQKPPSLCLVLSENQRWKGSPHHSLRHILPEASLLLPQTTSASKNMSPLCGQLCVGKKCRQRPQALLGTWCPEHKGPARDLDSGWLTLPRSRALSHNQGLLNKFKSN